MAHKNNEKNLNPKISIIMPVYKIKLQYLKEAIQSVLEQSYTNWELCIAEDCSGIQENIDFLKDMAAKDKRIKIIFLQNNLHISWASNEALKLATGEYIALLDHDDVLDKDALLENINVINEHPNADFIYSDEDKLEINGSLCEPFLKPDWSPDFLMSCNYICHFSVIRADLIRKVGGFELGLEGAQDYDLFLKVTEQTEKIFHIPKILYHWRKTEGSTSISVKNKPYAISTGKKALENSLKRQNIKGKVIDKDDCLYHVKYQVIANPLVSIIIPFKDKYSLLKNCLDSIFKITTYKNFEVILVNNNSAEKKMLAYLEKLRKNKKINIINYLDVFNYSAINNLAAKNAKGSILLFLNNDTKIISEDWIEAMLEHCQRKNVGAVGAKLLYSNNRIQHCGVVLGCLDGVAVHVFRGFPDIPTDYPGIPNLIRNYSAVTGACLMIRKGVFEEIGGFAEELPTASNDVDLCLKALKKGYDTVYTPYAKLYHYESKSRPSDNLNAARLSEIKSIKNKWGNLLTKDPFYNPNLSKGAFEFTVSESSPYYKIYEREMNYKIRDRISKDVEFKNPEKIDIDYRIMAEEKMMKYAFEKCAQVDKLLWDIDMLKQQRDMQNITLNDLKNQLNNVTNSLSLRYSPIHIADKYFFQKIPTIRKIIKKDTVIPGEEPIIFANLSEIYEYCKKLFANQNLNGLEIGGPSKIMFSDKGILPIYPLINKLNTCNFSTETAWEKKLQEGQTYHFCNGKEKGYQYIADCINLDCIKSKTYDFVLLSHVLEHIANPLKAMFELSRILKKNGFIILVLPNKKFTFDHNRNITTFEHILEEFNNNVGEDDLKHIHEILELHDLKLNPLAGDFESFKKRSLNNYNNRRLHHHVFDEELIKNVLTKIRFKIMAHYTEGTNIITIGKK